MCLKDSNNFLSSVGLGEREGRIYSSILSRRHFGFAHGIGRSGDIGEVQPKAAGSSILLKLTNLLCLHALHIAGFSAIKKCIVVPLATGMTLSLCIQTVRVQRPRSSVVLWCRIDQKSCFKSIIAAGLTPVVVECDVSGDEVTTNLIEMKRLIMEFGETVCCVLSTTSCFAPRRPDDVDEIARMCKEFDVPHVINNAYGLQCTKISRLVNRAINTGGRVDYVVQSTDKNFLVPVGGAIIASPSDAAIANVSKLYAGRASVSPVLDMFITLLSMGESGYRKLLEDRTRLFSYLLDGLTSIATEHGERVLTVPRNGISIGITLRELPVGSKEATFFGSMLFQRAVSGIRVINPNTTTVINGVNFEGWGAHYQRYPVTYFTAACAIGITEFDITTFLKRLNKALRDFKRRFSISASIRTSSPAVINKENEKKSDEDSEFPVL